MIRINSKILASVVIVAMALQLCSILSEAKPLKKNSQPLSFFNSDNSDQNSDQTGDANDQRPEFEFMNDAELNLAAGLDKANSDIDEDTKQNSNDEGESSSANDDDSGESSYERPEVAASHHTKKAHRQHQNGLEREESSPKGNSDSDNGPINEFSGNDREEHDKNMNSDISEANSLGGGQGESASASDESADQADDERSMANDETSNLDDDESSGSPVPVEHPRARAASSPISRPSTATRALGYGLESRPNALTNKKLQQNSSKRLQQVQELNNNNDNSNDDSSDSDNEQRDPMSRIVDRGEQDSADSKNMYTTTTDLKAAASGHHKHGHGVSGWLDMGAHSGKKGSFGWHDKHPVGGKGKK